MVEVVCKDLLQVTGFDHCSFVTVKDSEGTERFCLGAPTLVPSEVDDLLKEIVVEARALVVVRVRPQKVLLLLSLADAIEPKVVDDALEVTAGDQSFAASEVLEGVT